MKLTKSTTLKVIATNKVLEQWLSSCGFTHWIYRDTGERVGMNRLMREQDATVGLDENKVVRLFKTDATSFGRYNKRFLKIV